MLLKSSFALSLKFCSYRYIWNALRRKKTPKNIIRGGWWVAINWKLHNQCSTSTSKYTANGLARPLD